MFSFVKFLKFSLPVATGVCAIVATTILVASFNDKDKLKKDKEDEILKDLEKPTEEFKEEKIINQEKPEKQELDTQQEKGDKGASDKKQELTEQQQKEIREELVEKLINGQEVVLGKETLRGSGSESDSKGDVSIQSASDSLSREEIPSEPQVDEKTAPNGPNQSEGEQDEPIENSSSEELDVDGSKAKEAQDLDSLQETSLVQERGELNDDEAEGVEDDGSDAGKEESVNSETINPKSESEVARDGEGDSESKRREDDPPFGEAAEDTTDQVESTENGSGKGEDGIDNGEAEKSIFNLELLNDLESKLSSEIGSLGARLRSLGIV